MIYKLSKKSKEIRDKKIKEKNDVMFHLAYRWFTGKVSTEYVLSVSTYRNSRMAIDSMLLLVKQAVLQGEMTLEYNPK